MEKLQELVEVKLELDDDLSNREALVPQVEDLGLEGFVCVDVGHGSKSFRVVLKIRNRQVEHK